MKVIRIYGKEDLRIEETPIPDIDSEEVLIKVSYCSICGSDIAIYTGESEYIKTGLAQYPIIPGHEWSGIISKIGKNVKNFKIGDKVCGENGLGCMQCESCLNGQYHLCREKKGVGYLNKDGAYAEYLVINARWVHKLSSKIDLKSGALIEPASVGCYAIERGNISIGDIVLIIGDGPIGQFCAQFAKLRGAAKTIMIGLDEKKLNIAKRIGVDETVIWHGEKGISHIMKLTKGQGVNVLIESSGNINALEKSLDMVARGSRIVIVSRYSYFPKEFNINRVVSYNISINGAVSSPGVWDRVIRMIDSNKIVIKPLISGEYSLYDVEKIFKSILKMDLWGIKFLLKP